MNDSYDIKIRFISEGDDDIISSLKHIDAHTKSIYGTEEAIRATRAEEIDNAQRTLSALSERLSKQRALLDLYADDHRIRNDILDTMRKTTSELRDVMDLESETAKWPKHIYNDISKISSEIRSIETGVKRAAERSEEWKKELAELGTEIGKIPGKVRQFATLGGHIDMWTGLLRQAINQTAHWRHQNFEAYGSVVELSQGVREAAANARILQQEAHDAAAALTAFRISNDDLWDLTESLGRLSAAMGMSSESGAFLAKQMQMVGTDAEDVAELFEAVEGIAAQFSMTGRDLDSTLSMLGNNFRLLHHRMGRSESAARAAAAGMTMVAASATRAGMRIEDVNEIMQNLMRDATQYAVLLQDSLDVADPGAQFLAMGKNAQDMLDMLEGVPAFIRDRVAREMTGMGLEQLEGVARAREEFEEWAKDIDGFEQLMKDFEDGCEKATERISELEDEFRRATDPAYAFNQSLDALKAALIPVLLPLVEGAAIVLKFVGALLEIEAVRTVITVIAALTLALVALFAVIKAYQVLSKAAAAFGLFSRATSTAAQASTQLAKTTKEGIARVLRDLGRGIALFFRELSRLDWTQFAKGMAYIAAATLVLMGLAWVAGYLDAGALIEVSMSLVALAGAMWIFGRIGEQAMPSLGRVAGAMAILAGAFIVLGLAMAAAHAISGGKFSAEGMLALALGIVALAGAMWIMAEASQRMAKLQPQILQMAYAIGIVGLALIPMAAALWLLKDVGIGSVAMLLVTLAAAVGALALVSKLITPALPSLYGVAFALLIVGGAMILMAGALYIFAQAIRVIADIEFGALMGAVLALAAGAVILVGSMALFLVVAKLAMAAGLSLTKSAVPLLVGFAALAAAAAIGILSAWLISIAVETLVDAFRDAAGVAGTIIAFSASMAALAIGLTVLAGMMAIALIASLAAGFVSTAISRILTVMESHSTGISALPQMANHFDRAMESIARGAGSIAGSRYIMFRRGSRRIAAGMRNLFEAFQENQAGMRALPVLSEHFAGAMRGIRDGAEAAAEIDVDQLDRTGDAIVGGIARMAVASHIAGRMGPGLDNVIRVFRQLTEMADGATGADRMVNIARQTNRALYVIAVGYNLYANQIEAAVNRITTALGRATRSMWLLRAFGLDEMVQASAMMTVRTEVEEDRRKEEREEEQMELLDSINSRLGQLITAVGNMADVADPTEHLEDIKGIMNEYLPEIAETRKGFASAANQWNF